jgi:hypothetical protein
MNPRATIAAFDDYLAARGTAFTGIVIGGTALALIGIVTRPTRDCDVLDPPIPAELAAHARSFATVRRAAGDPLAEDWFDAGPASLTGVLPSGWRERLIDAFVGRALRLRTLGRGDLLASKLFALCDRGTDLSDCLALAPTAAELALLQPWLEQQDANPDWQAHTRSVTTDLARRLGYGL